MKAINYLEYPVNRLQYVNTDMWNDLRKATEFYSQEFKPELIEKYFEGWKTYGGNFAEHHRIDNPSFKDRVIFQSSGDKFKIGYWENMEDYNTEREPLTLNEFIVRATTNGIELTFNKTALQELNIYELKGENQSHEQ